MTPKVYGKTWTWTYDNAGNITSRNEYAYTTGELGVPLDTVIYAYTDPDWGDLLTAYDGTAITYDTIGNPLYDGTWTYTWEHGRRLASMTAGTTTWSYSYNADGLRTGRTDGTNTYQYVYTDGQLSAMYYEGTRYLFHYEGSTPVAMYIGGTAYYYAANINGDVVAIFDNDGNRVVEYTYDAWGNILSVSGSMADTIGAINPLRYRGYVYDQETGLYYVSSRYYNPEIGRWINADSIMAGVGGQIQGYNMFAYCFNNPVNMSDFAGHWPKWMKNAANWVNNNVLQPVVNFFAPSTNTIAGDFQEGILRGSGSLTGGYSEINGRLQVNSKDSKNNGMIGGFAKVSTGNASGKIGIGNDDVSLSLKGVGDGLTATAQAGVQYKNGLGLAAKAKAAVLTGRTTAEFELFGWQIEFGVSGDLLSVGAEAMIGVFPDEGFTAKASAGAGLFGLGFLFRVKPAQ